MNNRSFPKHPTKPPRSSIHIGLIILGALLGFLVLLDLSPIGGNYRMYAAWMRCGQKPVAAIFAAGGRFSYNPPVYTPIHLLHPDGYYCSLAEAQAAGYDQ